MKKYFGSFLFTSFLLFGCPTFSQNQNCLSVTPVDPGPGATGYIFKYRDSHGKVVEERWTCFNIRPQALHDTYSCQGGDRKNIKMRTTLLSEETMTANRHKVIVELDQGQPIECQEKMITKPPVSFPSKGGRF